MTDYAVLTATYDHYDSLKSFPAQSVDCETICLTDDPDLVDPTWKIIVEPSDLHPNRAAKRAKCTPWEYTNADFVIWIDASVRVRSADFVQDLVALADPIAQFLHPDRDCIYDEAWASRGMGKYTNEPIDQQMAEYRHAEHPKNWGLWATGVIVRQRTPEVEQFGRDWLAEINRLTFQDQLSEPFVLRQHGLRPSTIPGYVFGHQNPWMCFEGSGRH